MIKEFEYFQISQAGILIRDSKCLIAEFSNLPGSWDIPGGRLDKGEYSEPAFKREIKEELGLDNFEILGIVDYDIWYTSDKNIPVCGIASLIKNEKDEITLSDEHLKYKWITENEIDDYNFLWPNAKRMLKKGFERYKYLKQNE